MSKDIQEILGRLKTIEGGILHLHKKIDALEKKQIILTNPAIAAGELLELPSALRRTVIAMLELREGTAGSVAKQTKRSRGMESIYLNQLVRMGFLEKIKKGRRIYFRARKTEKMS